MLVSKQMVMIVEADEVAGRAWLTEQRRSYLARKVRA
jgi:hypothetical protein